VSGRVWVAVLLLILLWGWFLWAYVVCGGWNEERGRTARTRRSCDGVFEAFGVVPRILSRRSQRLLASSRVSDCEISNRYATFLPAVCCGVWFLAVGRIAHRPASSLVISSIPEATSARWVLLESSSTHLLKPVRRTFWGWMPGRAVRQKRSSPDRFRTHLGHETRTRIGGQACRSAHFERTHGQMDGRNLSGLVRATLSGCFQTLVVTPQKPSTPS
jgi:hypothetical protein